MPIDSAKNTRSESALRPLTTKPKAASLELVPDLDMPVAPGELVGGRYVVDGMLAAGGMGVVCLATHSELGQRVAIKFLRENYSRSEQLVQRFLNEARAAATLKSDHVVRIIDVGQLGGGRPYLVMEHLEGTDLEAQLVRDGAFDVQQAVGYALEVCEALEEAHGAGIVHRDIKPENLFLATAGNGRQTVKVVDFGLAKRIDASPLVVTGPQDSMGSPCYMSPEQITTPHQIDARTDIWSLGVVLYRLLTFTMPFDGSTVLEVYARVLNSRPKPLHMVRPDLDAGIASIVERCLQKNPEDRYQTVADLAADLAEYQTERSRGALRAEETPARPRDATRRRRGPGLLAVTAVALLAGFAGAWTVRDDGARTEARAIARHWVERAIPHTGGSLETALRNADIALSPVTLPDDPKLPGIGERFRLLPTPALGVVSRGPSVEDGEGPTLEAERELEIPETGVSGEESRIDAHEAQLRQERYRRFLESQRLTPVGEVMEHVPHQSTEPAPSPPSPSVDDLKAP